MFHVGPVIHIEEDIQRIREGSNPRKSKNILTEHLSHGNITENDTSCDTENANNDKLTKIESKKKKGKSRRKPENAAENIPEEIIFTEKKSEYIETDGTGIISCPSL